MYWGATIAGVLIGGLIASPGPYAFLGAVGGGVIAYLLARVNALELRIRKLEHPPRAPSPERTAERVPAELKSDAWPSPPEEAPPETGPFPGQVREAPPVADTTAGLSEPERAAPTTEPETESAAVEKPAARPHGWPPASDFSFIDEFFDRARNWLTTGNIPVKVGVLVSFVGVGFLLKYAIDRRLLVIPLELRLLAVAVAGLVLVLIGWRLRGSMRVYALSLQGGGLGILFLTIFAAFRVWELLPAPLAFILLVVLTACTGALSVLQNSRSLAILGVVGGFLAPVLITTGQGSHVMLFSYYLVLNGAILGIAWFRAWRELNLIGFVFTFVIGSLWGYAYYRPELWASTQPFLILYFLFYQAIAILYALRQPPQRVGIVDGTLVFGTPVITFVLQHALVRDTEYGLAISAAAAAVFYALTATGLFRRRTDSLKLLVESYLALAVAFATLAVPLALDARWTSAAWSLEGAALVWVGTRQHRQLAKLAGSALILLGGLAFLNHGWRADAGLPMLNGNVLGGVLVSLSAFFASRKLDTAQQQGFPQLHRAFASGLFLWAALWWLGTGWLEVTDRLVLSRQLPVFLLFLVASFAAGGWLGRARQWSLAQHAMLALLPLLALLTFVYQERHPHFLLGLGWLAWPSAWCVQAYALRVLDRAEVLVAGIWHFVSLLLLSLMLAYEAAWWAGQVASDAWSAAAASVMTGVIALLLWRFRRHPAGPVSEHPEVYLGGSLVLVTGQVIFLAVSCVASPGDPDPWPYLPVLNPFDLAMLFAMLTAALSLNVLGRDAGTGPARAIEPVAGPYRLMLAVTFFIMTTAALIRAVHHFSAIPWDFEALFESVVVQTSLSIYWGLLGFAGMLWGARRKQRLLWLAGAGFMALVVVKLFLIDLGNTGTIERIISFIGTGALLLVVGYFAPAPPRGSKEKPDGAGQD